MRRLIFLGIALLALSSECFAIDLPKDANGWTIFTPTAGETRILYVDPDDATSGGVIYNSTSFADPFQPSTAPDAYQTYAAAYAQTRADSPDWILIKRGATLYEAIGNQLRDGKDADEPFLVGAYGSTGLSPIFATGAGVTAISPTGGYSHAVLSGLKIYSYTRNPDDPGYVGGATAYGLNLLLGDPAGGATDMYFEGVVFDFYTSNTVRCYNTCTDMTASFYRCAVLNNYGVGTDSHGMFVGENVTLSIDECVFDHNGWYDQVGTADGIGMPNPVGRDHSVYLSGCTSATITESIFSRDASGANKITSYAGNGVTDPFIFTNNLYLDNEWSIGFGYNNETGLGARLYHNVTVADNVQINAGRSNPTARGLAQGYAFGEIETGSVTGNLAINQPNDSITNVIGFEIQMTNRNLSISNNIIHGLRNGAGLYIDSLGSGDTTGTFANNKIILADSSYTINAAAAPSNITFSGNQYYSNLSDGTRFRLIGSNQTNSQWTAATGDAFTFADYAFPDDSRNIEGYMASIGETNTIDAFIAAQRAQDRYNWDSRLEADTINDWIRAGFWEVHPPNIQGGSFSGGTFSGVLK